MNNRIIILRWSLFGFSTDICIFQIGYDLYDIILGEVLEDLILVLFVIGDMTEGDIK